MKPVRAQTSTISSKGQITVPIEVRKRLGLRQGDRVEFAQEQGRTVLKPARGEENPFLKWVGAFPAFKSLEESDAWLRDLRGYEDDEL